jgi:flagellar motor switch protein FliM
MAELFQEINLKLEVRLDGCTISTEDLVKLAPGQVLLLDYPLERQATAFLNGRPKFSGDIVPTESKLAFTVRSETGDSMV